MHTYIHISLVLFSFLLHCLCFRFWSCLYHYYTAKYALWFIYIFIIVGDMMMMARVPLVAGNWKMNTDLTSAVWQCCYCCCLFSFYYYSGSSYRACTCSYWCCYCCCCCYCFYCDEWYYSCWCSYIEVLTILV